MSEHCLRMNAKGPCRILGTSGFEESRGYQALRCRALIRRSRMVRQGLPCVASKLASKHVSDDMASAGAKHHYFTRPRSVPFLTLAHRHHWIELDHRLYHYFNASCFVLMLEIFKMELRTLRNNDVFGFSSSMGCVKA